MGLKTILFFYFSGSLVFAFMKRSLEMMLNTCITAGCQRQYMSDINVNQNDVKSNRCAECCRNTKVVTCGKCRADWYIFPDNAEFERYNENKTMDYCNACLEFCKCSHCGKTPKSPDCIAFCDGGCENGGMDAAICKNCFGEDFPDHYYCEHCVQEQNERKMSLRKRNREFEDEFYNLGMLYYESIAVNNENSAKKQTLDNIRKEYAALSKQCSDLEKSIETIKSFFARDSNQALNPLVTSNIIESAIQMEKVLMEKKQKMKDEFAKVKNDVEECDKRLQDINPRLIIMVDELCNKKKKKN